jgi:hypothetical protein
MGLPGESSFAMLPPPVVGGGSGGMGLPGESSFAMLPPPVVGGGSGGMGLPGESSTAMRAPPMVTGVAKAEEVIVVERIAPKIIVQIVEQVDFMEECSFIGRNTLQRKGNPNGEHRLPQK